MEKTYYDILGIKSKANIAEIKNAYRQLVQCYHPDKYNGRREDAEKLMTIINCAYRTLVNPNERMKYDEHLKIIRKSQDDFVKMKQLSHEFNNTHISLADEIIKKAENDFKHENERINHKRGLDKYDNNPLGNKLDVLTKDLEVSRNQDDIETLPTKISEKITSDEFNKIFEETLQKTDSLIKYPTDITAFNDVNAANNLDFDDDNCGIPNNAITDVSGFPINNTLHPDVKIAYDNKPLTQEEFQEKLQQQLKEYENVTKEITTLVSRPQQNNIFTS